MKIAINTSHQRFGGAIQVALSFINECRNFPQHEFYVWVGPGVRKSLKEDEFPPNFHFEHFDFGVINFKKTFAINVTMREVELRVKPDVIIATSGPSYFHSKAPQVIGYNLPLYIYPESPYVRQISGFAKLKFELKRRMHYHFFKRDALAFVVQTDDVNARVRKELSVSEVYTVTNTASGYYQSFKTYSRKLPLNDGHIFRFLTVSSYYRHKNLEIIPEILKELKKRGIENVEFVLTLRVEDFTNNIGDMPGITNVGPVAPPECPSLYNECDAMFLPSLAECFSASYPEAMIMEKPILTTDLGFAKSICGTAALYYEPKNAIRAADEIVKLITDDQLRSQLVNNGKQQIKVFDTPELRAKKYLEICTSIAESTN